MTDSKCTGSLASLTDGTLSLHSARYTRLRVFLIFLVLFSDARARARAEDTTEEFELRRFLSKSCLFERSASFDLNSTEKEVHQHVFSFEGIRARESILSAHPPSPSICLSLSLSLPFKREESEGTIQFFSAIQIWEIGRKKGEKRTEGPKFGTLFFFFVLDEFWDDAFVLLCVKWRRRPSKNMSTMWSLALSR